MIDDVYTKCIYIELPFGKYAGKSLVEVPLKYLDETIGAITPQTWLIRTAIALVDEVMQFPSCSWPPDQRCAFEIWDASCRIEERAMLFRDVGVAACTDNAKPAFAGTSAATCSPSSTDLMLAAILLNRFNPLAPHHCAAIRAILREHTDDELLEMVRTGKWPNVCLSGEEKPQWEVGHDT